ncbi:SGNH/GDSL hydrolase family protein [Thalassovita sp.]|uniref:SGNH/GDSL hydrolase family protein n=1 Tax=Thalassovita sp. TaxID=1979401 RepID=UPI0028829FE3|nr:SGNH/GDSL hydrolase family protein [Thalassovita sp.]MDF1801732.1 hypothetical protein [Thalassovita sp.]
MAAPQVPVTNGEVDVADINSAFTEVDENIELHKAKTNNPHGVTAAQVGLGNADNTSDLDKPVSTAQQAALNGKSATDHGHEIGDMTGLQDALDGKSATGHGHEIADVSGLAEALAAKVPQEDLDGQLTTDVARPGEDPAQFSAILTGDPAARPVIVEGLSVVDDDLGAVWSLPGAASIAPRRAYALELGRIYRLRVVVKRLEDSSDPNNDAVEIRWQNLNKTKGAVSNIALHTYSDLLVATGAVEFTALISRDVGGADYVPPATARFGVPEVRTYGADGKVGIAAMSWEDVTDQQKLATETASAQQDSMTSHKAAVDQHQISGIVDLQAKLDEKAAADDLADEASARAQADSVLAEQLADKAPARVVGNRLWPFGVIDAVGRMPLAISRLGRLFVRGVDVSDLLSTEGLERSQRTKIDTRRTGYFWGVIDGLGRLPLALNRSGDLIVKGVNVATLLTASAKNAASRLITSTARSGYAWGVIDAAGRIVLGLTTDARLTFRGQDVTAALDGTLAGRVNALESNWASGPDIVCWGDSLTQGAGSSAAEYTYPAQLASLTGRAVENLGVGSQSTAQISARAEGQASLLTVTGGAIPASGPVAVTDLTIELMYFAGGAWSLDGSLAGVLGTLDEDGSGGYTFTRTEAGAVTRCLPGTPFIPADDYDERLHVIWLGRNDYSHVTDAGELATINARIKEHIAAIVASMKGVEKRFIVLGVTSRHDPIEYVGTANYDAKRDLAADLASLYPRSFIDIDAILRASGDGGATDNADIANGVIPSSLLAGDGIHLVDAGYSITASEISSRINQNGW